MSTVDGVVDKKKERRRLMSSDKFNRIGFKEEKVGFAGSSASQQQLQGSTTHEIYLHCLHALAWGFCCHTLPRRSWRLMPTWKHCCSSYL